MRFEDLRLIEPLLKAVRAAGYAQPTPIQCSAIPLILEGRDVLGSAQTGTGKTAAFALPILQLLNERTVRPAAPAPGKRPAPVRYQKIRALVLAPTRELAHQILDSFADYGDHLPLRGTVVYGGVSQVHQVRALRNGVDILVATPGRLLDLMGQGFIDLSGIEILVLDEADRMLDMGFMPDIRRILAEVPDRRQSLLFSATMPGPIRKLADDMLDNPAAVEVSRVSSAAPSVAHWVYHVEKPEKAAALTQLLSSTPHTRALVFTRTKHGADKLTTHLTKAGVRAAAIHGNKSQGARTRALAEFRSAQTPVLIATDIAARGLDVDDISHVINYDLTCDPETYVHRIGRTGRAGATGTAVSFCTSEDHDSLRAIERLIREPLQPAAGSGERARTPEPAPRSPNHRGGGHPGRRPSGPPSRSRSGRGGREQGRATAGASGRPGRPQQRDRRPA